jgi:hypothetical protein
LHLSIPQGVLFWINIILGFQPFGPVSVCSMHHQNSSSDIPFQANTGMFLDAIAAAAWS